MKERGRKSAAELTVVTLGPRRPDPPEELTVEQAEEWRAIVGRMPADWFSREHYPLLAALCFHVCRSRMLAGLIDTFPTEWLAEEGGLQRLDKLLAMAERETRCMTALSRAMRLTQRSRIGPEVAATKAAQPGGVRPWDRSR